MYILPPDSDSFVVGTSLKASFDTDRNITSYLRTINGAFSNTLLERVLLQSSFDTDRTNRPHLRAMKEAFSDTLLAKSVRAYICTHARTYSLLHTNWLQRLNGHNTQIIRKLSGVVFRHSDSHHAAWSTSLYLCFRLYGANNAPLHVKSTFLWHAQILRSIKQPWL